MLSLGFKAKLYAIFAAIGLALVAALKVVTMQRDAAREDARRAKKHMNEAKQIGQAQKQIREETREAEKVALEAIKNGEMPDNIRDRNTF